MRARAQVAATFTCIIMYYMLASRTRISDVGLTRSALSAAFAASRVDFAYQPGRDIFRGLSLKERPGEFVALLGPSGCGKSTLLNLLSGFLAPDAGAVTIGGRAVTPEMPELGYVFQAPNLFPWLSVLENVRFGLRMAGELTPDAQRDRARRALALVGLADAENELPNRLSGGMQQRVSLCRALIHKPKLLLMDEPFGALDEFTRLDMNDLLLKVKAETGASVLFVTHSIAEAIYLSDKVVVFTRRPARVSTEFEIRLPGPRSQASRFTPEFTAAERRASEALGLLAAPAKEH